MNPGAGPHDPLEPADRADDPPPPILGRWSRLYALVIAELIGTILLCGWLSRRA